jgi:hypothetical protein
MKELSMKLFALRDTSHRLVKGSDGNPVYFANKREARDYRKTLTDRHDQYFVTYGIDHKLYKGQ